MSRLPHRCCNGRGKHHQWCKVANRRAADKQAAQRRVAAETVTLVGDLTPAMFCTHANEVPMSCPCPSNCYCKAHTCRAVEVRKALQRGIAEAKRARAEGREPESIVERAVDLAAWRRVWSSELAERKS